jgi:chromosomal replication initiator protein
MGVAVTRCANCIINDVSRAFEVPPGAIRGTSRKWHIAYARFAAFRFMREETKLSYPQIGRLLGHRDHSTVIHGIERAQALLATNADFAARFEEARAL